MSQLLLRSVSTFVVAAALLFCGSAAAEEFKETIEGKKVERNKPGGNFVFKGGIDGGGIAIIRAPEGAISFEAGIDGGSKALLEAGKVTFNAGIDGGSVVLIIISKKGNLELAGTDGGSKVFWCKADDNDPQPAVKQGGADGGAEVKQVTREEMDKLIGEHELKADEPPVRPAGPAAEEGPTADQFYLKVESLIDNVADLDVRRFTVLAPAGKTLKFHIGEAGIGSKGHRTAADKADVRRMEAIVVLRLHGGDDPKNAKIRRLMKFHRTKGNSVESELDASGRESLAGVVEIKAKSGRYPVGKPLTVGTVHGENLVVTVE